MVIVKVIFTKQLNGLYCLLSKGCIWFLPLTNLFLADPDGSSEILRLISESHLSFKYDDLRKATKDFDLGNKIGQGGYGSVYKVQMQLKTNYPTLKLHIYHLKHKIEVWLIQGTLPDGREIAVKRLFINTTQWLDQFFNEVNLISQVQHKNLVKLLGCSVEGPESLLVYEYLCNTSLDRFLFGTYWSVNSPSFWT